MSRQKLSLPQAKRQAEAQDLAELLADARFKHFLLRLFEKATIFASTYSGPDGDTFYREGRRALGLDVLRECLAARPDALVLILAASEGAPGILPQHNQPQGAPDARDPGPGPDPES